ncbi:Uncharacterised protein [Mycobacteroides abscessus]|nr:Uncharacterised protein [Mycobacteroides abscessus]CPZ63866.1 Uncharacterised protein [Mycobacteroides abscessus]
MALANIVICRVSSPISASEYSVSLLTGLACIITRSKPWLSMFSNQMPVESRFTISCRDSSICSARDMRFHTSVPYSETTLGGR